MKEIENGLYALHSCGGLSQSDDPMDESAKPSGDPIAVVNKVTPGSPASIAVCIFIWLLQFVSCNDSAFC